MRTSEIGRFLRFSVVGAVVAAIYVAGFTLLSHAGMNLYLANLIAFTVAVTFQYLAQTLWTFKGSIGDHSQGVRFGVTIGLGLALSTIISSVLAPAFGWPSWLAASLVAVLLPITNFVAFRFWVYRHACRIEGHK